MNKVDNLPIHHSAQIDFSRQPCPQPKMKTDGIPLNHTACFQDIEVLIMNFTLPISVLIAAVLMVTSSLDKKFNPQPEISAEELFAYAEPSDSADMALQPVTAGQEGYGFRVQIFSTASEEKARALETRLKYLIPYPLHIHYEDEEWKLRVGDFVFKEPADELNEEIRQGEFKDAWVVECPINIYEDGFRVQMASMKSAISAATYARLIEGDAGVPVHVSKQDDAWKVRAGDFETKADADALRDKLAAMGYKEVWVVLDRIYP